MIAIPGWVDPDLAKNYRLSVRQVDVLAGLAKGMTNATIARALSLSEDTVKTHVKGLFRNLHVADRCSAVAMAYDLGLLRTRARRIELAESAGLRVVA